MIGMFAFFVNYTLSDWFIMICNAMDIPVNPLVMMLVTVPITLAIYVGIRALDDQSKGW